MRARAALLLVVSVAATLAGPASAQTQGKPRRPPPPPRPVADAPVAPVAQSTPTSPLAAPQRVTGLSGLAPVGDPGPACRAQCSKDRYVCHAAGDATDCDSRWIPCLRACAAP